MSNTRVSTPNILVFRKLEQLCSFTAIFRFENVATTKVGSSIIDEIVS
jgi:hypothetical protein